MAPDGNGVAATAVVLLDGDSWRKAGPRGAQAAPGKGRGEGGSSNCPSQPLRNPPGKVPQPSRYLASGRHRTRWASPSPCSALSASPLDCSSLTAGLPWLLLCHSYTLWVTEPNRLNCSRPPDAPFPAFRGPVPPHRPTPSCSRSSLHPAAHCPALSLEQASGPLPTSRPTARGSVDTSAHSVFQFRTDSSHFPRTHTPPPPLSLPRSVMAALPVSPMYSWSRHSQWAARATL